MDSAEIVRKRLVDLKRLSEELKYSTEINSTPDYNVIKAIIDITKNTSPSKSSSLSRFYNEENEEKFVNPKISPSLSNHHHSHIEDPEDYPLFPEHSNKNSQLNFINSIIEMSGSKNHNSNISLNKKFSKSNYFSPKKGSVNSFQDKTDQQQMIQLRKQNLQLQLQVKQMKIQLTKYKSQQQLEEFKGRKVPYFRLQGQLNIFLTKLNISQSDYQRLEYQKSEVRLTLDRLLIEKIKKNKTNKFFSSSSSRISNQQNQKHYQQLYFSTLKEVQYINNQTILLIFIDDSNVKSSLFIQFDDAEELMKWELGFYINYQIIHCLHKTKLFNVDLKNYQDNSVDDDASSHTPKEKQIILKFLEQKKMYFGAQKELKQSILKSVEKVRKKKQDQRSRQNSSRKMSERKSFDSKKNNNNNSNNNSPNQQNNQNENFSNSNIIIDNNKSPTQQNKNIGTQKLPHPPILLRQDTEQKQNENNFILSKNQEKKDKIQEQIKGEQNKIQNKEEEEKRIKQETQKTMQLQYNRLKQQEAQKQRQMEKVRKMQEQAKIYQEQKKLTQALKQLKKGFQLIKYATGALKPHEKLVYIDNNAQQLCWKDKGSTDKKNIFLSEIVNISKGQIGPGITNHQKKKQRQKNISNFFVIYLNSKERPMLEFKAHNVVTLDQFVENLNIVLKSKKK